MATNSIEQPIEKRLIGDEKRAHALKVIALKSDVNRYEKAQKEDKKKGNKKSKRMANKYNKLFGEERFKYIEELSAKRSEWARNKADINDRKNADILSTIQGIPHHIPSLRELIRMNTTQALGLLVSIRWRGKVTCPHCGSKKTEQVDENCNYHCLAPQCLEPFNVYTRTIFDGMRMDSEKLIETVVHEINLNGGATKRELVDYLDVSKQKAEELTLGIRRLAFNQRQFKMVTTIPGQSVYEFEIDVVIMDGEDQNRKSYLKRSYRGGKNRSLLLVIAQRGGNIRTFEIENEQAETVEPIIRRYVPQGSIVYTDKATGFGGLGQYYVHKTINHSLGIYGNDEGVTTNTVEGFNSFLKCGLMKFRNNTPVITGFANGAIERYNLRNIPKNLQVMYALNQLFVNSPTHIARVLRAKKEFKKQQRKEKREQQHIEEPVTRFQRKPSKSVIRKQKIAQLVSQDKPKPIVCKQQTAQTISQDNPKHIIRKLQIVQPISQDKRKPIIRKQQIPQPILQDKPKPIVRKQLISQPVSQNKHKPIVRKQQIPQPLTRYKPKRVKELT